MGFFFQAEGGIRDYKVTGVQTCALPILHQVGGANLVDHENIWETFPLYARVVYTIGDAQCHQLWYRSFLLNGNQMPIDQRMTSMYLFANLGLLAAIFARPSTSTGQVMLNALPEFLRRRLWKFG